MYELYSIFVHSYPTIPMHKIPIGIHHFTRRILTKEEAGFINAVPTVLQIEYVQFYFHLYKVPIIPTLAGWYARHENGALEKLPPDIMKQLNAIYHPRFSLWACMGPIMLITALVLIFLGHVIADYYSGFDELNNSKVAHREMQVTILPTAHF